MAKTMNLHGNKNASATKRGPGRFHEQGHKKSSPVAQHGTPRGFVLHTNPAKKDRRDLIAIHGRRQFLRMLKEDRAMRKAANDERTDALSTRHYPELEAA